ncbi:MAG: HAMP domain-containing histidine kinase [Ruminococcaceae bacterium]|nr:HAMP domain-containing histidine kinase [Oscillospiraceae bacterium]
MRLLRAIRNWPHSLHFYITIITLTEIALTVIFAILTDVLVQKVLGIEIHIPPALWLTLISIVIGAVLTTIMNYFFFRPVTRLSKAMKSVAKGEFGNTLETNSIIEEIKELYASYNLMTKELANTEMLQSDFVSNVSHEFKTPINAIEGYATLLQDGSLTEEEKNKYVHKILHNTRRVSDLVGNILLLSKVDNQAIQTKPVNYRLDEQIRQAILLLEEKWSSKGIDFDLELDEIEYYGNESIMLHVWTNIIDNAVKFSPDEGAIAITASCAGDSITVAVEDNGPGIPADKLNHIFDKFYQADSSHKEEGNGLGLALVKQILDVCGGRAQAENKPSGGCIFTVTLKR